jgi:hypothetical protein
MNQPNSVPGFRPDLLSPDYEAGGVTDYVPRPKTAIESMELVSDLPKTSIAERVAARSELRGYDIGQHPQVSDHLAKVAFARLHGEPPYDTV